MENYVTSASSNEFTSCLTVEPVATSSKNVSPNNSIEGMTPANLTPPVTGYVPSIAGALASISSVTTVGVGVPNNMLDISEDSNKTSKLSHKSSTRNSLPEISSNDLTRVSGDQRKRRGTSFLHLNIPEHGSWTAGIMGSAPTSHMHGFAQHLQLPTFTLTPAAADGSNRKFSFAMGLRRLSQTVSGRVAHLFV